MTLKEAIEQNEGLTNMRFLALAYEAVKELGKFVSTDKIIQHILSNVKQKRKHH